MYWPVRMASRAEQKSTELVCFVSLAAMQAWEDWRMID